MKITLEYLIKRNACRDEQEMFVELFGTECEWGLENLEKYVKRNRYAFSGLLWLGINVLDLNRAAFAKFYWLHDRSDPDVFARALGRKLIKLLAEENEGILEK